MVRSRDHDWSALQCRGPCWVGAELPSPVLAGLKMPSKQDRHEIRSWSGETHPSGHNCQEHTKAKPHTVHQRGSTLPRGTMSSPQQEGPLHLGHSIFARQVSLPQLSFMLPRERT